MLEVPVSAQPDEVPRIRELASQLAAARSDVRCILTDKENRVQLDLPASLFRVLVEAAQQLANGRSVVIVHYDEELTTQQAADLLQVSRPYLIRLLEEGQIPYHYVGTHRRIRMGDLLRYRNVRAEKRRAHLKELIRVSDALGLYDDNEPIGDDTETPAPKGD
jgi:excisionase family DNA binding protein